MKTQFILAIACIFVGVLSAIPKDGERDGICPDSKTCHDNDEANCLSPTNIKDCNGGQTVVRGICSEDPLDDYCKCCVTNFHPCKGKCKVNGIQGECYNPHDPKNVHRCDNGRRYDKLCGSPTCTCCIPNPCTETCRDPDTGNVGKCVAHNDGLTYKECLLGSFVKGLCGGKNSHCVCFFPQTTITLNVTKDPKI